MRIGLLQRVRQSLFRDLQAMLAKLPADVQAEVQVHVAGLCSYVNAVELRGEGNAVLMTAIIVSVMDGIIECARKRVAGDA